MNVSTDNLQWRSHTPQSDSACNPSPQPLCHQPIHGPKYVYTAHLERTTTHTKYIHLYPDNQNSRWVVDQWCPSSFCSLSKDDTRASRYHGVWMYSITDVTLVGVIGKRVSGFIPQTPRQSPEEHNSARGEMLRRGQASY